MLYRARDGLDARSRGRSCPVSQAQLTPSTIRAFPVLTIPAGVSWAAAARQVEPASCSGLRGG
jgi:hypothetical protein